MQNVRKEGNIPFIGIPPVTRLLHARPNILKVHHIPTVPQASDHAVNSLD